MRLASFNISSGRSMQDGRTDPGRLGAAVASLEADVLAVQEVDRGQDRSEHVDQSAVVARALGTEHARFVPTVVGTPGRTWRPAGEPDTHEDPSYGVALVSRWPVTAWRRIPLGSSPGRLPMPVRGRGLQWVPDEPRVAVAAVLAPGSPVGSVVASHLSFVPGVNVRQLLRLVRAVGDLPSPVVLLGDLNLPGAVVAAVLPGWTSLGSQPTFPAHDPRVQLDHALVRGGASQPLPPVRAADAVHTAVSDHRAMVIDLEPREHDSHAA